MIHAEEILKLKRVVNRLYVKHTGQSAEEIGKKKQSLVEFSFFIYFLIEKLLERDKFFDAESAKRLGLIDKVLEHPVQDMQIEDEKQSKTNNEFS
jgi:ATP-dependent Clp protease protease subunit